jgi:hypothetical protein
MRGEWSGYSIVKDSETRLPRFSASRCDHFFREMLTIGIADDMFMLPHGHLPVPNWLQSKAISASTISP